MAKNFSKSLMASEDIQSLMYTGVFFDGSDTEAECHNGALVVKGGIMDHSVYEGMKDPNVRKIIWDILIQDVSERQMTIFISSHHLNELDSMCDHIALIDEGKIVFEESLDELKNDYHKLQIVLESGKDMYLLEKELNILSHQMMGRVHTLIVMGEYEKIEEIVSKYDPIINEALSLSLEEIFLYTMKGEYDEFI